jgi:hypothetical protein
MKPLGILLFLTLSAISFAQKPNILVFFVDDMGYSELGVTTLTLIYKPPILISWQRMECFVPLPM